MAAQKGAETILVYVMTGSQFAGKALAALDARKIPHHCFYVAADTKKRKEQIPSGRQTVPEIKVGTGPDAVIVSDSEAILHWLDDNRSTNFFPNALASELSVRASDKALAGSVYYYNWVNDEGYHRSMRHSISKAVMPTWLPNMVSGFVVDMALKSQRKKMTGMAATALGLTEEEVQDEKRVHGMMVEELKYFQSFLKSPSEQQPYILPGEQPTAPDFSVYVQVERLIGDMGDAGIPAACPTLKEEGRDDLKRIFQWHTLMRERHPLIFKGKGAPEASL